MGLVERKEAYYDAEAVPREARRRDD